MLTFLLLLPLMAVAEEIPPEPKTTEEVKAMPLPPPAPLFTGDANQIDTVRVQNGHYVYAMLREGIFVRITCQSLRYAVNTDGTIWRLEFGKAYLLPIRGKWSIIAELT